MPGGNYYKTKHWRALREARKRIAQGRCEVPACPLPGFIVDHIVTRPDVPYATAQDLLSNTRLLCRDHDNQQKEKRRGQPERRGTGFRIRGCDVNGWPLDPKHRWNQDRTK